MVSRGRDVLPWNISRHSVLRTPPMKLASLVSQSPDPVWLGPLKAGLLWSLNLWTPCPWVESLEGRSHRSPMASAFSVGLEG